MVEHARVGRFAAAIPAVVLAAFAAGELWSALRYPASRPEDGAWAQVNELLVQRHRPGELIAFAPGWIDPIGRRWLGEHMDLAMAGRMDSRRYPVIWEISRGAARIAELEEREPQQIWEFGELRVRRHQQNPAELVYDFSARLTEAEISGSAAGRPRRSLEEVGFEPHWCVRAEPRPGQTVTIRYPRAALGTELVGYVGLADVFTRRDIRSPGSLRVSVNGRQVAAAKAGVDDGWVGFRADTEPSSSAEVVFSITARDPRRLVCFAAEARR